MKHGNWMPIDATMARYLPKDREYTELEAIYCLQLNYDKCSDVTVAGLAKAWNWKSRGKVYRFLDSVGVEIIYPKAMEKKRNKRGKLVFQERTYDEQTTDIGRTNNGHIRLINNKWLDYETDIKRAYGEHKTDIGRSTINHTHTQTDTNIKKEEAQSGIKYPMANMAGSILCQPIGHLPFENNIYKYVSRPIGMECDTNQSDKGSGEVNGLYNGYGPGLINNYNPLGGKNGQGINGGDRSLCDSGFNRDCLPDGNLAIESETGQKAARETKEVIADDVSGNLHPGLSGPDSVNHLDNQGDKRNHPVVSRNHEQKKVVKNDMHRDTTSDINFGSNSGIGNYGVLTTERNKDDPFVDIGKNAKEVKNEALEAKEKNKVEPPPEPKKPKKKKNGVALDLSKVDTLFEESVLSEFFLFRSERGNPVDTQTKLNILCNAATRTAKALKCDPNHAMLFACRAAGTNGWLVPKLDFFLGNEQDFWSFCSSLKSNITQKNNMIECKKCAGESNCDNSSSVPISSCGLFEEKNSVIVWREDQCQPLRATTVSQAMIIENDSIAKALLLERERKDSEDNG